MEVEASVTYRATPTEFATAVATIAALPGASPPVTTVQLDCSGGSKRWEFVGEDRVRAFLRRGASIGPQADRVLEKRRAADPVDLGEWPIRVNLKTEKHLVDSGRVVPQAAQVRMRLKRRVSVEFQAVGVRVDMTVVMESDDKSDGKRGLQGSRHHELEVEALLPSATSDAPRIAGALLAFAHTAYSAAKGTSRPLTATETARAIDGYAALTKTPASKFKFVGPSPVTLNRENLVAPKPGSITVLDGYTVTDKADGDRRLMLIHGGTAYLVDNRGGVTLAFEGVPASLNGTMLDGELITRSRLTGTPMRMFAVFDAYWHSNRSVAELPLLSKDPGAAQRVNVCKEVVALLHAKAVPIDGLHAVAKKFVAVGGARWGEAVKGMYLECTRDAPYEVDGLIFTPASVPAGARGATSAPELTGGRWALTMKWKPPSHNSVDFLVRYKRDPRSGADVVSAVGDRRVKTAMLYSGYNPAKYEAIDPYDYLTRGSSALPRRAFIAKVFAPPGAAASVSEAELTIDDDGRIMTEDGDAIEDNTIVEFRWDMVARSWKPMRVRHDKNERMAKAGLGGTLNEWSTAMGVWNSIQNPVTLKMVTGEEQVPPPAPATGSDVYYDRGTSRDKTGLTSMANFHNLTVKAGLYEEYGPQGGTLLELACGKGGDMPRWLDRGFTTIVGVDYSNDNIVNPDGGVYSRWDASTGGMDRAARPHAIFVTLDASVRMFAPLDDMREASARAGQAPLTNVMFGLEPTVPKALEPFNGVMTSGFDLVSCQFAVHYMFRDDATLDSFVANVARLTRLGGHFIGTTFDGDAVASALARGTVSGRVGGTLLWDISYPSPAPTTPFKGETGRAVDVYVATIGKAATEYLVSFRVLAERMQAAGLELVKTEMFGDAHRRSTVELTPAEKGLSFFYRSFAFVRK